MKPYNASYETPSADPAMVSQLTQAMTRALEHSAIPDVTTTADVISAMFTMLDHTLRAIQHDESPEDQAYNAREIGRVLSEMLMEFGAVTKH